MKKVKKTFKKFAVVIILITTFAGVACAQQGNPLWQPIGQDTVSTNRDVKINQSLKVKEKTTTSIMEVKDYLKVGDSAIYLVGNQWNNFNWIDHIRSDVGRIAIMNGNTSTFNSNIKVGIGTDNPNNTIQVNNLINFDDANYNTFIGKLAGLVNSTGWGNSFFGYQAGIANTWGDRNSFFGYQAGLLNNTGRGNSFIGGSAGASNVTGNENTFIGWATGAYNNSGIRNSFIGSLSGCYNTVGSENTFLGTAAGMYNYTGSKNTLIGCDSYTSLENTTAIGWRSYVSAPNCMVLGYVPGTNGVPSTDPRINVGIGTHAPSNRLEITEGNPNQSGLTFTNLTSGYNPTVNDTKFLTVDAGGKVILANGGGGNTTICNTISDNYLTKKISTNTICQSIVYDDGVNVGISTATPVFKLDVNGDIRGTGNLSISTNNVTGGGIILSDDGDIVDMNDGFATHRFSNGVRITNANSSGQTVIQLSNGSWGNPTYFNSGNFVGIGTVTPGNTLEIGIAATNVPNTSGFRLRALVNQAPLPSNSKVLSIDDVTGDVVLRTGGTGNISACSGLTINDLNFIPKWSAITNPELCKSIVYDNNTSVGIGNFSPANQPQAAFDINTNLIPGGNTGDVFRTTSDGLSASTWRLFTGQGTNNTEKFQLFVPANTGNVVLQASTQGAIMQFNVAGPGVFPGTVLQIPRMVITDGSLFGNTGLVAMGNNFLNPQSQLHINDGFFPTHIQITNYGTNSIPTLPTANDGFKVGISASGDAEILQQEGDLINPKPIRIKLSDGFTLQERITILNNGFTGFGTLIPDNVIEINTADPLPTTTPGGNSGLRFQDLTTASTPLAINPGTGVLSVDNDGNVVYVQETGGGFGVCPTLPSLTSDIGINMAGHNIYFDGNYSGNASDNNITIGTPCGGPLQGKLVVYQNTNAPNASTIGIHVINEDIGSSSTSVIGIKARTTKVYSIAGWFQTNYQLKQGPAIYVPQKGGATRLGFSTPGGWNGYYLEVASTALIAGITIPSDSKLKTDISDFNNGLDVVRNMNTIHYRYNGKAGFTTDKMHVGVIAEELADFAPYAIDTFYTYLDTTDIDSTAILCVKNEAIMYTAINAIKELDSIITYYLPHLPPLPPVLALPQNGATNVELKPLILAWYKNPNAEWYQIELALDNSFEKPVFIKETFDTMLFTGVDKYNTTYYWRVMAFNKKGKSAYSQVFSFTTKPVPGTATLIAPENGAVNVPLEAAFMWSNGIPVHKNIIEVAIDADFKELVRQFSTPDSSVTLFLEKDETVHYWRVTTYVFPESSEGAVSETWSFTTQPKGFVMDTVYGTEYRAASDINFKTNIAAIDNPLDKVLQLNGISYNWRVNDFPQYNFGNSRQLGFNGQEVEQVVPEVVSHDANGYYSVDYGKLVPVLVEAMKVMSARLDALEGSSLQKENGETGSTLEKTIKYIELSSKSIVLEQNVPNPFAESTSIDYSVPEDAGFVQIIFTDKAGRIIRAVDIEERGNGQLVVYAQNLSAGMYSYTIVVDGEQIVTRKMIKVSK